METTHRRKGWLGTRVSVTRVLCIPVAQAWLALTDLAAVRCWLGELSEELRAGGQASLDFGDGDFFTLADVRFDSPRRLAYTWRFLGIGPPSTITWQLKGDKRGCRLTVTDEEKGRSPNDATLLREGWLDFTDRLSRYVKTGSSTRYDWRREVEASVEVPGGRQWLLAPEGLARWLPVDGMALRSGASILPENEEGRGAVKVGRVSRESPTCVQWELDHGGAGTTTCEVKLAAYRACSLLRLRHWGWEQIGGGDWEARRQRARFCAFWVAGLRKAQGVTKTNKEK